MSILVPEKQTVTLSDHKAPGKNMSDIDNAAYVLFGTKKRDGSMVDTPVWFAGKAPTYYIFSAGDVGKVKRLRNFVESRIAPCTVMGKALGEFIECSSVLVDDPQSISTAHQELVKKYGWQMRMLDLGSRLSGKYRTREFIKVSVL